MDQGGRADVGDTASRGSSLSILFADESRIIRQLIQRVLTKREHKVDAVEDGEAALDALRGGAYDVALLDLHLPKGDGLAVAKAYRAACGKDNERTRLIGFTADVEGMLGRSDCAVFDLIAGKPIDVIHLCSVLEEFERENAARSAPASVFERRSARRMKVTGESGATLLLESGERVTCRIRELSLEAAALDVDVRPPIGQRVMVGRTAGFVVRHTETGIAVQFTKRDASLRAS